LLRPAPPPRPTAAFPPNVSMFPGLSPPKAAHEKEECMDLTVVLVEEVLFWIELLKMMYRERERERERETDVIVEEMLFWIELLKMMYVCICMCTCIYTLMMYVCICTCICIYTLKMMMCVCVCV